MKTLTHQNLGLNTIQIYFLNFERIIFFQQFSKISEDDLSCCLMLKELVPLLSPQRGGVASRGNLKTTDLNNRTTKIFQLIWMIGSANPAISFPACILTLLTKEEARKSFFHDKIIWQNDDCEVTNDSKGV